MIQNWRFTSVWRESMMCGWKLSNGLESTCFSFIWLYSHPIQLSIFFLQMLLLWRKNWILRRVRAFCSIKFRVFFNSRQIRLVALLLRLHIRIITRSASTEIKSLLVRWVDSWFLWLLSKSLFPEILVQLFIFLSLGKYFLLLFLQNFAYCLLLILLNFLFLK